MSFSSPEFIYIFLPLFCAAYYLMPPPGRNALLLAGSVIFYVFGCLSAPAAIVLMLVSAAVNWLLGLAVESGGRTRAAWLWAGAVYNIGILFLFKYLRVLSPAGFEHLPDIGFSSLALPLGLSFTSFRAVGYLSDVCHARCCAEHRPGRFALWFFFFPTVLQGPITRYPAMAAELEDRSCTLDDFVSGIRGYLLGLSFKILIADRLLRLWQKVGELGWESVSSLLAWISVIAYSLYIYFDFAGYSLMAIGIGRMLGFTLPQNFLQPYASRSMTEFWRRWHVTLGNWFRDYIYIPLGGNRKGTGRTYFNLLCVWLFTGIWHGSTFNFVLWGLLLFAVIAAEKLWLKKYLDRWPVLGHAYMALLIPLSWAVFAVSDLSALGALFLRLFPFLPQVREFIPPRDWLTRLADYWPYLTAGLVCCTGLPEKLHKKWEGSLLWDLVLAALFCLCVYFICKTGSDPFAYGNF